MKGLNAKLAVAGIVALSTTVAASGCGGDTYVKVQGTTTVSKGQELIDLQDALNEGAINRDEYDRLRAIILKRQN
jgi:hypothetical protein